MESIADMNYLIGNIVNDSSFTSTIKIAKLEVLKTDVNRLLQESVTAAYNCAYDNDINPTLYNVIQIGIASLTKLYLREIDEAIINL